VLVIDLAKRVLGDAVPASPPLRGVVRLAQWLFVSRQRVGVLAVVQGGDSFLLGQHVFRHPQWGLLGGWLRRGEDPEAGLLRELREELGADVDVRVVRLLAAIQQEPDAGPRALILVYHCRSGRARLPRSLPFELLQLRWVSSAEARRLLPSQLAEMLTLAVDSAPGDTSASSTRGGEIDD
jgi:8-oxo-dGTP pyrophosphatase MutT (NUDIX family)